MRFKDKIVIITGAGQGIGRAFAKAFAGEGAKVVIAELNEAKARAVAKEITDKGQAAITLTTDVTDEVSVNKMGKAVLDKYGRVDVLVNNAGILAAIKMKPFWDLSVNEWDQMMAVNVKGMFLCCKALAPAMKAQKSGRIINMSSSTVLGAYANYLHYVASKAAVIGLTRAMARELGDWNITVNGIIPGATETEVPRDSVNPEKLKAMYVQRCLHRAETPEDLVGTALFLASDDAAFITGQMICCDGGMMMY